MESLRPNRQLLNPKFEGYKLALDPLTLSSTRLLSSVNNVPLREESFSLQHIRAFGNHNHLVIDSWTDGGKTEVVYFVNENYEVQRAVVKDTDVSSIDTVFKTPAVEKTEESLNSTLFFPSQSLACLCDGSGKLYLLQTGDRIGDVSQNASWKVGSVYQFDQPSLILHAIQSPETGCVSCLLLSITENDASTSVKDAHNVHLELITFSQVNCSATGSISYSCEMLQQFRGHSAPVYAGIECGGTAILVASERPFSLVKGDSEEKPSGSFHSADDGMAEVKSRSSSAIVYKWSQDSEDVTVKFVLPDGTKKDDIACNVTADSVDLQIGKEILLSGPLYAKVNPEESTWTVEENSLELILVKQVQEHHWSSVVQGDDRGVYELVGEEAQRVEEIHNRLEHLTSDKMVEKSRATKMSFSNDEFEECDAFPEDIEYIFRLDVKTGELTHKVCLASHQWIFNASLNKSLPPAFCIRHDVDALVWQPKAHSDSEANWIHTGTFNALGYVQAAKRDRKFSTCAPDLSYAVICDNTRHVYVYQQPVGSAKHANQQVVTLTTPDNEILGLQASNNRIFVLTRQAVHVVTVK